MLTITVNGETRTFTDENFPRTGRDFWSRMKLTPGWCIVVVDGLAIGNPQFAEFTLQNGMEIELIRFVGGG